MRLLDELTVDHGTGQKRIELYHGDLVGMPPKHAVDLLILSARPGDYRPLPGRGGLPPMFGQFRANVKL